MGEPTLFVDHDWTARLSRDHRQRILDSCQQRNVPRGSVLFHPRTELDECYLLLSGRVHMLLNTPDGREFHADTISAPGSIGVLGCIEKGGHVFRALAASACSFCVLPGSRLREWFNDDIEVTKAISSLYANRFRLAVHVIHGNLFFTPRERLLALFVRLARFEPSHLENTTVGPLSQEDLARMLGLTRQTIGKELNKLKDSGFITSRYKYITLLRPGDMLEEIKRAYGTATG